MFTATTSAAATRNPPAFTDLVALPRAATFHFGRVARRYPAPAPSRSPRPLAASVAPAHPGSGVMAAAAQIAARALARAANALRRQARQWSAARERRFTERALRALDTRTLHDIGLHRSEISSIAAEAAYEFEASRARVWHEIARRTC